VAWRSDWAERQVIWFVESVLETVAQATSIAGLIAEVAAARKYISSRNFGFFAVVIAVGEFPASLSSEVIWTVQLFPGRVEFLRTATSSTPPPGCQVFAAHNTIMGLCDLLQGQCERQRTKNFCFFLPPAADWSRLVLTQQAWHASAHVMSESCCCDALVFTEMKQFF
jgi:hypothetical protein